MVAWAPMRSVYLTRPGARRSVARGIAQTTVTADALGGVEPKLTRTHCKRCGARWGAYRLTLDTRDTARAIERIATIECARCARTLRRVKADTAPPTERVDGVLVQRVRMTLILPAKVTRWYSRGAWHRTGDDGTVLTDATLADVDEAARLHRAALTARLDGKARAKARKEASDLEAVARSQALLAAIHAREAEQAAEEAAAVAREA